MDPKKILAALLAGSFLSSCGTVSTFQTGKTIPRGKFSFGMGSSLGVFRTKSHIVGFPTELPYGAAEVFAGYGLFEFLDINAKVMASQYTSEEDFGDLGGLPLTGGGSARFGIAQERWGSPISIAIGYGYYGGSAQSRRTDLDDNETNRQLTTTVDKITFVNVSRDIFSWLTPYFAYKLFRRMTHNREWDYGVPVSDETLNDNLVGYSGGISFNVGKERNTHIMLEMNTVRDTDEPEDHYQKQVGLGMSVEF